MPPVSEKGTTLVACQEALEAGVTFMTKLDGMPQEPVANVSTESFFRWLENFKTGAAFQSARGTIRFEISTDDQDEEWFVGVDGGTFSVSRKKGPVDCIVRLSAGLFQRLITGNENLFSAILRNEVTVEGDMRVFTPFRWLLRQHPDSEKQT